MNFLIETYHVLFYQPLLNGLILLYSKIPGQSLGLAVILVTFLAKVLLLPLEIKSLKSQKILASLEPELKKIRMKFKNDKAQLQKETLFLYQRAGLNPFSGFLLILIQLPLLIALYQILSQGIFSGQIEHLYSFVSRPEKIETGFFIFDLARANFFLAALCSLLQFFQTKTMGFSPKTASSKASGRSDFSEIFRKQMLYFFPVFTFFILLKIPSAIALYLIVSFVLSLIQSHYVSFRLGQT